MRSKKNKEQFGSNKLKAAGAASLHREGTNNSELSRIAMDTGHTPQMSLAGTPSGYGPGSAGLAVRKAESNVIKVNSNPLQ